MSADQLTILAVDDERTQLEDLARMLRTSPVVREVECAYDGHEALLKASAQTYDAIFLDVRMPDLDGLELGRVLRRFASPPQLVFVSAHDAAAVARLQPGYARRAMRSSWSCWEKTSRRCSAWCWHSRSSRSRR